MAGNEPMGRSWWSTVPGVITALAGLVTAVGGFLVVLSQLGFWKDRPTPAAGSAGSAATVSAAQAPTPAATDRLAALPATPGDGQAATPPSARPLEGRPYKAVVVTAEDRSRITLRPNAEIAGKTLPLENGLSIDLEKVASIEMLPPGDGSVRVILIDGQVLEARAQNITISGSTELGPYLSLLRQLRRIEFVR